VRICLLVCGLACVAATPAAAEEFVGSLHEHSGYSDGWPGSRPADYFASGKSFGLDFMGGSDHSDTLGLPIAASDYCLDEDTSDLPACALADSTDSFRKWDATAEQAAAATDDTFTAFRGFEWTSDRFGHISVYFSSNYTNAKTDTGYAGMTAFWQWLALRPQLGGGGDGLAVFNHPGSKKLSDQDPGYNWNNFRYLRMADKRVVGIEVFNDRNDFDSWYPRALDKGWHVGAIGGEDLGHRKSDDWGGPEWAKTVIDAPDRSAASLKAAMLARHFYAIRRPGLGLEFSVNGAAMGSRLSPVVGDGLGIEAGYVGDAAAPHAKLDLVTSRGKVVATGTDRLDLRRPASAGEDWYFVRASAGGRPIAYSSPVWIEATPAAAGPVWLAGDLHVHTCYSHDSYCPPDDDNTGPDELYTAGLTVGERFFEARERGLDYLAITDHNDIRSQSDPGFGSQGLIGIPAYENSLHGHAQMLGATHIYDNGDSSAAAVNRVADELRADGGVFQMNHPFYSDPSTLTDCNDEFDWKYGLDVVPDVVEAWNSASQSLPGEIAYWERCWLDRGLRIGATGGSDSHWLSTTAVQGTGNPTTWVLADTASPQGILDGIRNGRTTISRLPPGEGGGRLLLEADADGDGGFESRIGDTVPADAALRVRSVNRASGFLRVRANGKTLIENKFLPAGGTVAVPRVGDAGWVRAELRFTPAQIQETFRCDALSDSEAAFLPCPADQAMEAITSPIWLRD
jgi:predicted metal-dependent phosphoesterase TrpH